MSIDTPKQRRSVVGVARNWRPPGQTPNADKDIQWRLAAGRQFAQQIGPPPPPGEQIDIEVALATILYEQPDVYQMVGPRIYSNRAPQSSRETPTGETYLVISRTDTQTEYVLKNQYVVLRTVLRIEIWQQDVDRTSAMRLRKLSRHIRNRISGDFGEWAGIPVKACVLMSDDDFIERPKEGSDAWWFARRMDVAVVHEVPEPTHT